MTESKEALPLHVGIVPELSYVPKAGIVGSYGGGDAMKVAMQMLCRPAPLQAIPQHLKQRIPKDIEVVIKENNKVPMGNRVAKLPDTAPDPTQLQWSATLEFSGHVYEEAWFNMMYQGFLFDSVVTDPQRLGASKYPLIGLYEAVGILPDKEGGPASVGRDRLKWADQHIHKVDFHDDQWHFGSDMAKFAVDPKQPIASAWCVMVDLESLTCNVLFLLIVRPELEGTVEKALRKSKDGLDVTTLKQELRQSLGPHISDDTQKTLDAIMDAYTS